MLRDQIGFEALVRNLKPVADLDDAVDLLGIQKEDRRRKPKLAIVAWQRKQLDDPVQRLETYARWAIRYRTEIARVVRDTYKKSGRPYPLSLTDFRLICVCTDRTAYYRALTDPNVLDYKMQLMCVQSINNDLILVDHLSPDYIASILTPMTQILAARVAVPEPPSSEVEDQGPPSLALEVPRPKKLKSKPRLLPPMTIPAPVPIAWNSSPQHRFLEQLFARALRRSRLHINPRLSQYSLRAYLGKSGMYYGYHVARNTCRAELWIPTDGKAVFESLSRYRELVSRQTGLSFVWGRHGGVAGYRVTHQLAGGWGTPERRWRELHDDLIDAMIGLESSLRPYLEQFYDKYQLTALVEAD